MEYEEFCLAVKTRNPQIDPTNREIHTHLKTAYEIMPKGLTADQERAYISAFALGYQAGKLEANLNLRGLISGLRNRLITPDRPNPLSLLQETTDKEGRKEVKVNTNNPKNKSPL